MKTIFKFKNDSMCDSTLFSLAQKLFLILSILPFLAFATQSNVLEFVTYNKNDSLKLNSYLINAAYVTNCNSCSENAKVSISDNKITFDANRQDSKDTVEFAQQQLSDINISWSSNNMHPSTGAKESMPQQLNFFLEGELTFKFNGTDYVCDNFMLGQGSNNGKNNWWGFTNTTEPLPNIPADDYWYSYQIQCDVPNIANNTQTFWIFPMADNNHMFAISASPLYGPASVGEKHSAM